MKDALIYIKGNIKQINQIEKQIKNNFTKKEIKSATRDGLTIEVKDLPKIGELKEGGRYCLQRDALGRDQILIDDTAVGDGETVTHEMVHLCRNKDPKRKGLQKSFIKTENGKRSILKKDMALEEALTVAETIMRTDSEITKINQDTMLLSKKSGLQRRQKLIILHPKMTQHLALDSRMNLLLRLFEMNPPYLSAEMEKTNGKTLFSRVLPMMDPTSGGSHLVLNSTMFRNRIV